MAKRYLLIAIDDTQPLGPQLKAARALGKVPWKLLAQLCGGVSTRHLQRLEEMSSFCDRQTVQRGITLPADETACGPPGNEQPG